MLNGAIVVFLVGDTLHWSASDLASAALCEYATLRALDYKLGRVDSLELKRDPLQEHIARLGDRHEARILDRLKRGSRVAVLEHVERPHTVENLSAAEQATREAFASDADVIYQPAFFDGEFFGYADFVLRTDEGWQVCDAKLARSAKPAALLQLGAYADQVARLGLPLSPTVSLLLEAATAPTSQAPTSYPSSWSAGSGFANCSAHIAGPAAQSSGATTPLLPAALAPSARLPPSGATT